MIRIVFVAAAVVIIGIVVIVQVNRTTSDSLPGANEATPPNYDTTGGQQMQPRWNR